MALSVFVAISVLCADKRVWGQGVDCHVSSQTVCKPAVRRFRCPLPPTLALVAWSITTVRDWRLAAQTLWNGVENGEAP